VAVRILFDDDDNLAALYCSTSDWAFGPVFQGDRETNAQVCAVQFLDWLAIDPRTLDDSKLEAKYSEWLAARNT
jgi:hypothetical protein